MKHGRPRYLLSLALGTSLFGLAACTADLTRDGASNDSQDGPSPTDEVLAQRAEDIAKEDAELREADPDLFAIAQKYFPSTNPGSPTPRYFRLSRRQLDNTAEQLLPGHFPISARETLPADPLIRNYELANDLRINGANFTPYVNWLEQAVEALKENPEALVDCSSSATAQSCQDEAAEEFVRRAFRGVPDEETIQRFVAFFRDSVSSIAFAEATADLASVTLSSPHFAFREEVHTSPTGQLSAAAALQNLTYTLADVPPSALGLSEDNAAQYFESEEAKAAAIADILKSSQARDKLLRFFITWLEIKDSDRFDIEETLFPEFTPEVAQAMVEETETFLRAQLSSVAPTLRDITGSTESFVSEALSDIYGIEGGDGATPVLLPSDERLGIFTHPAFLTSHSGPTGTKLVHRGAYFTRKVMCQELGEVPADAIPEGPLPGDTERLRIEAVTKPASCAGCHSFINPFGFMLEAYDPIGRFRTEDENGFPVDTSIEALFLDEGPVDTNVPVEALAQFTESAMFRQCFVQQLFTFYTARRNEESDDPLLRKMFFRFSEGDNLELPALLSLLANSDNFNRRIEAQ